jgi:glyoxylase-like metal-dependent hydrolase (beta-lactamase superfamily II)
MTMHRNTSSPHVRTIAVVLGFLSIVVLSKPGATASQSPAAGVSSLRLYVFDCGVLKRGEPTAYGLTRSQVGDTNFSNPCYLVVHPRGTMLWDVGIIPDDQITGGGVEQQGPRGINAATRTLRSQLKELGYGPRDITYLAISHGHADHVANANEYAGAVLLVQRAEFAFLFSEAQRKEPFFPNYAALRNSKVIELDGDHDVFGDGTVVLKSTPGHTPGHQSLFLKLAKTGPLVLTGDLYHYPAERTLNTFRADDNIPETRRSRIAIDELLKTAGAQLWIQHDIIANATIRKSPQYYD